MPNNSNLPKPNIPNPNLGNTDQKKGDAGAAQAGQSTQSTQANSTTRPNQTNPAQAQTSPGSQPSQPNQSAQASHPTQVAGLDPQSPGGAPPQLNEEGQVTQTSTISQTPQVTDYKQKPDLPASRMQQIQQMSQEPESSQNAQQTAIMPGAEQQQQPGADVSEQETIQAAPASGQQADAAISQRLDGSLGGNMPSPPGTGSKTDSPSVKPKPDQAKPASAPSKKKQKKSTKAKGKKKTKASLKSKAKFAEIEKPVVRYLLFGLASLIIIAGVAFGVFHFLNLGEDDPSRVTEQPPSNGEAPAVVQTSDVTLTYWGLWEPDEVLAEVLQDFEQETGIVVNYSQQLPRDYRTRLQSDIASGRGPDIFRFHATWVPMLKEELAPLPTQVMSTTVYKDTFYPIAAEQLQVDGQIVGIPLMYDGLGLYYNKEVLQMANEQVPETWAELRSLAARLTVRSGNQIERGGMAIGNTQNVDHFSDILALLIYQNGGNPAQPMTSEVKDAIEFYASFAKSNPVYSTSLPSSTVAFARGEVAMMLAPSWRAFDVQNINPDLEFDIAPVPKLTEDGVSWATYWAEGVNRRSQHRDEAWQLLEYLSSQEVLRKLYSEQSQIRAFGEIYPRPDMANELVNSDYVSAFIEDAPRAKSWYLCSRTHDDGLNDRIIEYYQDVVNTAVTGNLTDSDLETLNNGVNQTLRQYNAQ